MTDRHILDRHRLTSRVLLFDERDRLLLFLTNGSVAAQKTRWLTPGGGVEPGETHAEAARRELWEETGFEAADLGRVVWREDFSVDYTGGDHDTGHVEFFALHTTNFEPSRENWTDGEKLDVLEHRWWSLAELISTTEVYEPSHLVSLVRRQLPSC